MNAAMHDKLLTYLNIALILVCGGCVAILAMERYEKPEEISKMEALSRRLQNPQAASSPAETGGMSPPFSPGSMAAIGGMGFALVESRFNGAETEPGRAPVGEHPNLLIKSAYMPFYTPTPTPTPTPPPPPPLPLLEPLTHFWKIASLDEGSAELMDLHVSETETFTMKPGGPPHMAKWTDGVDYPVRLQKIDIENAAVVLTFDTQTRILTMQ